MKKIFSIALIVLLLLGCAAPAPTIDVEAIKKASYDEGYAAGVASVTPTPAPTETPEPTPTSYPYGRLSTLAAIDAVNELIERGVDITRVVEYDEETDPNELLGRPHSYTQKVNFRLNLKYEGTVEIFENIEDATARADYVEAISANMPSAGYYVYQHDLAVFRIELRVTPSDAEAFNSVLDDMDKWS